MLKTYSCFIQDRRYAVPTLRLIDAADDEGARQQALRELAASQDHLEIELHGETGLILKQQRRSCAAPR
jgi:hypothetical protein